MLTTTTDTLQGQTIEDYLGVVTAEIVYGSNALRDFFAGFRDFFGGRTVLEIQQSIIEANNLAEAILENPPLQGYLTISNALQWRLHFEPPELVKFLPKGNVSSRISPPCRAIH